MYQVSPFVRSMYTRTSISTRSASPRVRRLAPHYWRYCWREGVPPTQDEAASSPGEAGRPPTPSIPGMPRAFLFHPACGPDEAVLVVVVVQRRRRCVVVLLQSQLTGALSRPLSALVGEPIWRPRPPVIALKQAAPVADLRCIRGGWLATTSTSTRRGRGGRQDLRTDPDTERRMHIPLYRWRDSIAARSRCPACGSCSICGGRGRRASSMNRQCK